MCPQRSWLSANGRRRTFFCLLLLANGVPMFAAGDEFLQTQRGNNNPYNQDNETTWLDWSRKELHADHFRFAKRMIAFRKSHPSIGRSAVLARRRPLVRSRTKRRPFV